MKKNRVLLCLVLVCLLPLSAFAYSSSGSFFATPAPASAPKTTLKPAFSITSAPKPTKGPEAAALPDSTAPKGNSSLTQIYANAQGEYQLSFPSDWLVVSPEVLGFILDASADEYDDLYNASGISLDDIKDGFVTLNITLAISSDFESGLVVGMIPDIDMSKTNSSLFKLLLKEALSSASLSITTSPEDITITFGNNEFSVLAFDVDDDEETLSVSVYLLSENGNLYFIVPINLNESFFSPIVALDDILASFKAL